MIIIKYIPLQQGLRLGKSIHSSNIIIIKYIPLQQGLRHITFCTNNTTCTHY